MYLKSWAKRFWALEAVVSAIRVINLKINKRKDISCTSIKLHKKKHKTFDTSYGAVTLGRLGFKLKYPFIYFGSNNGSLTHKTPKYGKVLINIDLWVFTA